MGLLFVKGYHHEAILRNSFNELAQQIFGINFEPWYQAGYWTDKYVPYSFVEGSRVVANVSVNKLDLMIDNVQKKSIQIGTVMTHPEYRGYGLSKTLMNRVLEDFAAYDYIYLFANQSVLDFYPKFGFYPVKETQFSQALKYNPEVAIPYRKLEGSSRDDRSFIYDFSNKRKPISKRFGTMNAQELLMFYCMYVFTDDIYYFEKENVIAIARHENNYLHMYDFISQGEADVESIIQSLSLPATTEVIFHFTADSPEFPTNNGDNEDANVLFVRTQNHSSWPGNVKHPLTSQA
ncbi:GNAT family N-acetyltransferase [Peribacillus deserti]|nr:GNAT family N-acetyltransferase [Peribacillus deserti]